MFEPIELLAWDSQFFGKRVGRLILRADTALEEPLQYANQLGYELLYIYRPIAIEESFIGKYALLDVGGHITFSENFSGYRFNETKPVLEISEFQLDILTPELLEIAFLSGNLSRFKLDPSLPTGSFEKLYETWLTKTLNNRPESAIYTYQSDGRIVGLITAEWHEAKCTIGLLAVLQTYRGLGIATALIRHVKDICITNKVDSIEVKTQLSNTSARALYLKNSFTEHDRSFLYHAHNHL